MAAIYMWFEIYEEEYTTTLYPLESDDALLMSVAIGDNWHFGPMPQDEVQQGHELVDISVDVKLLSAPEQYDEIEQGHTLVDIEVRQLLLSAPEQNDEMEQGHELIDITVVELLIRTYLPDQGMLITADLIPGSCNMTAV